MSNLVQRLVALTGSHFWPVVFLCFVGVTIFVVAPLASFRILHALRGRHAQWVVRAVFLLVGALWACGASVIVGGVGHFLMNPRGHGSGSLSSVVLHFPELLFYLPAYPFSAMSAISAQTTESGRRAGGIALGVILLMCLVAYPAYVERAKNAQLHPAAMRAQVEASKERVATEKSARTAREAHATPWRELGGIPVFDGDDVVELQFQAGGTIDLVCLENAPRLKVLNLGGVRFPTDSLTNLKECPELQTLMLMQTGICDEDLVQVGKVTGLRVLQLSMNPRITNLGMRHLRSLANLENLDLIDTTVDAKGSIPLAIIRPNLVVQGGEGMGAKRADWRKSDWRWIERTLGEEAFQQALREAGLDGIPADAPEEPAANGVPIQWHIAEKEFADVLQQSFRENSIGISIIFSPIGR